jgi:hypothetical protein
LLVWSGLPAVFEHFKTLDFFAPAQLVGYAAMLCTCIAFCQSKDKNLRAWMATQNTVYALHFYLLGNLPAMTGCSINAARNILALHTKSWWAVGAMIGASFAAGFLFTGHSWFLLPLLASALATFAVFRLSGVALRLVLIMCSVLWFINNYWAGSIGGIIIEIIAAVLNTYTLCRLLAAKAANPCSI